MKNSKVTLSKVEAKIVQNTLDMLKGLLGKLTPLQQAMYEASIGILQKERKAR